MKRSAKVVSLAHGSGGRLMNELISKLYLKFIGNPVLNKLTDAADFKLAGSRGVFTTDSFVVKPLFFPGGDIGKLSVAGTLNDLLMLGGIPKYISLALIIQEDFPLGLLESIIRSVSSAAKKAGVKVITGDTKVVDKNACDGIFINTSGIGEKIPGIKLGAERIRQDDDVIVNGFIAEHGAAIISAREDLKFKIKSDCESLEALIIPVLKEFKQDIHFLRDPTRGGLATTLNEIVFRTKRTIIIEEEDIPLSKDVEYACEILGLDPLYLANEGKVVMVVKSEISRALIKFMKRLKLGEKARVIGKVGRGRDKKVIGRTKVSGLRLIDMREGDPLPRIC